MRGLVACSVESGGGLGFPPPAGSLITGPAGGVKSIRPVRRPGATHSVHVAEIESGAPPDTSTRFSFLSAKNPTLLASGDQKGKMPPSVPASATEA